MDKTIYTSEYAILLKLLAEVRASAGVTQVQLGQKLNLTQSTISKIERGDLRLDVIQLRTICKVLGTSIEQFILKLENDFLGKLCDLKSDVDSCDHQAKTIPTK